MSLQSQCWHYARLGDLESLTSNATDTDTELKTANMYGQTVLVLACMGNHVNVVRYLVEQAKVDVNRETIEGKTAIVMYVTSGHSSYPIISLILLSP